MREREIETEIHPNRCLAIPYNTNQYFNPFSLFTPNSNFYILNLSFPFPSHSPHTSVYTPKTSSTVPTLTLLHTHLVTVAPVLALQPPPHTLGRHHQRRYQLQKRKVVSEHRTPLVQLVDHLLSLPVVLAVQERQYVLERLLWQINHFVMYPIILSFCSCSRRSLARTFPVAVVREVEVY